MQRKKTCVVNYYKKNVITKQRNRQLMQEEVFNNN